MNKPRVKKGAGPNCLLTDGNHRKKALPFLLKDFERRCAYCLDLDEFRIPSHNQVEHFNCKIASERKRNHYKNLMLGCVACNFTKRAKPTVNPLDKRQRFLNCTEENEFLGHIIEREDGQWEALTPEGEYHLVSIGLCERSYKAKRYARRQFAIKIRDTLTTAVQYQSHNPPALHKQTMDLVRQLTEHLEAFPPLVTAEGVFTIREWLAKQGVNTSLI